MNKHKKPIPRPFSTRLSVQFAFSIILPLLLCALVLAVWFASTSQRDSKRNISNLLFSAGQSVSTYLDDLWRFSYSPNAYTEIMNLYQYINSGRYYELEDPLEYNQKINRYTLLMSRLFASTRSDMVGAVFLPMNSDVLFVVSRTEATMRELDGYGGLAAEWRELAGPLKGAPWFEGIHSAGYYGGQTGQRVVSTISLVRNVYSGTDVGVMKIDIDAGAVESLIGSIDTGDGSALLLLDAHGGLISNSNPSVIPPVGWQPAAGEALRLEKDVYTIYVEDIEQSGWQLVYLDSQTNAAGRVAVIVAVILLAMVLCLIIGWLIFRKRAVRETKPLGDILATMQRVAEGDLTARATPDGTVPEFALLAEAFNGMTERLNQHIESEYKAAISQRTAEYYALQAQVNPHFLYNTLNMFIGLNRMNDRKRLEDGIILLTRMFRYTCEKQDNSSIGEELAFVRQYLSLQKMRFEERLEYRVDADDEILDIPIPKLLIQPLVENSIVHGMKDVPGTVTVQVDAQRMVTQEGSGVLITIYDDGSGFDTAGGGENSRVGLNNIRERLALFTHHPSFFIESTPGMGTIVSLVFITQEASNEDFDS